MSNQRLQITNTDTGDVAIIVAPGAGQEGTRYTLPLPSDSARYLTPSEVPAGVVTVEVEAAGEVIRENVQVGHVRPPAAVRKPGGKRPGVGISKTTRTPSGPGAQSGEPSGGSASPLMKFSISRGEAFHDLGQWLSEGGWAEDRVWLQTQAEVDPPSQTPPGGQTSGPGESGGSGGSGGSGSTGGSGGGMGGLNLSRLWIPLAATGGLALVALGGWYFMSGFGLSGGPTVIAEGEGYEVYANGTVFDKTQELQWTACVVGQNWADGECRGDADKASWDQIGSLEDEANTSDLAGHGDWRLPEINELKSYPETEKSYSGVGALWSATEQRGISGFAQGLDQTDGSVIRQSVTRDYAVRLVREPEVDGGECQDC